MLTLIRRQFSQIREQLQTLLSGRARVEQDRTARALLGDRFKGYRTDVASFGDVAAWAQSVGSSRTGAQAVLRSGDPEEAGEAIATALAADAKVQETLTRLGDIAKIDAASFMQGRTLVEAAGVLEAASGDSDGLFAFATFATAIQDAGPHGIMPLLEERLGNGGLAGFGAQIEALAVRQLAKSVYGQLGSKLSRYRGAKLDQLRAALAEKDKELIQLSRRRLRARVKGAAHPPRGNGVGRKSTWTDMALIENEIGKKQRYISGPGPDATGRKGAVRAEAVLDDVPACRRSVSAEKQHQVRPLHHRRGVADAAGVGHRRAVAMRPDGCGRRHQSAPAEQLFQDDD